MSATTTNSHDDEDGNDDDDDDADQVGRHPTSEATDTDHGSYPSLLRVLCLHDVNSNALELSHRLDAMGDRLFRNHGIDLVFVNSPLLGRQQQQERHGSPEAEQPPPATFDWSKRHAAHPRVWWETADVEGRTGNPLLSDGDDQCVDDGVNSQGIESRETDIRDSEMNDTKHYVGLDASLLLLRQIWTSTPFWGILAFGQGASVASFFPLMAVPPTPGFCIFVEGTTILDEDELLVVDDIPCLHIVGECIIVTIKCGSYLFTARFSNRYLAIRWLLFLTRPQSKSLDLEISEAIWWRGLIRIPIIFNADD